MMVSKTHNFRERGAAMPPGLDVTNFAHRRKWPFRFHNQADQLYDTPAGFSDARISDALYRTVQAI